MKRGFTLIELLVVVLIIGILAAVALPMYKKAVMKTRVAELEVLLNAFAKAQDAYFLEHGSYQDLNFDDMSFDLPGKVSLYAGSNGHITTKHWQLTRESTANSVLVTPLDQKTGKVWGKGYVFTLVYNPKANASLKKNIIFCTERWAAGNWTCADFGYSKSAAGCQWGPCFTKG